MFGLVLFSEMAFLAWVMNIESLAIFMLALAFWCVVAVGVMA